MITVNVSGVQHCHFVYTSFDESHGFRCLPLTQSTPTVPPTHGLDGRIDKACAVASHYDVRPSQNMTAVFVRE